MEHEDCILGRCDEPRAAEEHMLRMLDWDDDSDDEDEDEENHANNNTIARALVEKVGWT